MPDEKAGGAEAAESFSEEDLSHVKGDAGGDDTQNSAGAEGADKGQTGAADGDKGAGDGKQPDGKAVGDKAVQAKPGKTIATGADAEADDKANKEAETDAAKAAVRAEQIKGFREALAKHASAGDKKAFDKELKRLERLGIERPEQVYGLYRELDNKLNGGGLVKIPGKDAKPEELSAFAKALGWTEKPDEMLGQIKLENGAVLGDADKPALTSFAVAVHGATTATDFMNKATNWYFKQQEDNAAALDEADDTFKRESVAALKEEFGPTFKRSINAIGAVFATAPGGVDVDNTKSLFARLMGGRTADGKIIGDDPDINRFFINLAREINPAATLVEDGRQGGKTLDAEIAEIEKIMKTDRREYNQKHAGRYAELLAAREKIQSRQRA